MSSTQYENFNWCTVIVPTDFYSFGFIYKMLEGGWMGLGAMIHALASEKFRFKRVKNCYFGMKSFYVLYYSNINNSN